MIGLFGGIFVYFWLLKKFKLATDNLLENISVIFFVGLVGARATYVILYPEQFASFYDVVAIWQGGLVSYGGILAGILIAIFEFRGKYLALKLNLLTPSFFIGWIFGRIGGFLTENAIGKLNNFYGQFFYYRVPTQLFESFLALAIAALAIGLIFKIKNKIILNSPIILIASLGDYGLGRFVVDFWRDDPAVWFGLQFGQITSLFIFFCCIITMFFIIRTKKFILQNRQFYGQEKNQFKS